jgi:hypothetical protein
MKFPRFQVSNFSCDRLSVMQMEQLERRLYG